MLLWLFFSRSSSSSRACWPSRPESTRRSFQTICELLLAHQELLAAGAALDGVDRREQALVGEVAAQPDLHVAGALELLEDHLVHLRAALDEGGGEDGQRAAVLDVAGGAEELLRRVERRRVDTTGQDPAGRRARRGCRRGRGG